MSYITKSEIKSHLNIDDDYKADDDLLVMYEQAAESAVEAHLNRKLSDILEDGRLPYNVKVAILMLVGNFYSNREATSYGSPTEVPLAYTYLLNAIKAWQVP